MPMINFQTGQAIKCELCNSQISLFIDPHHNQSYLCISCAASLNILESRDAQWVWRATTYMKERIPNP